MTKPNCTKKSHNSLLRNRLVHGVGFNSGGKYLVRDGSIDTIEYITWSNMIKRCYSPSRSKKNLSYKNCTVSPEFHDFQDFAEWYVNQQYYGLGYVLDKDILCNGNKVYSPEFCCLVPMEINNLFIRKDSVNSPYPIGVDYREKNKKFVARLSKGSKRIYLGIFKTVDEAFSVYAEAKEQHVKEVADKWKGSIDDRVYTAMMEWKAVR